MPYLEILQMSNIRINSIIPSRTPKFGVKDTHSSSRYVYQENTECFTPIRMYGRLVLQLGFLLILLFLNLGAATIRLDPFCIYILFTARPTLLLQLFFNDSFGYKLIWIDFYQS